MDFKEYCEKEIFVPWKKNVDFYADMAEDFQTECIPEPYCEVAEGKKKLFVLNYNPGKAMDPHHRDYIKAHFAGKTYEYISKNLLDIIQNNLNATAKNRLDKMKQTCDALGFDGLESVETFFLHSSKMDKDKFLKKYKEKFVEYTNCLKAYLKDKTVLAVCAVSSRESISRKTIMASDWLKYQAEILGVNFATAELFAVRKKEGKTTCAFLVQNKKIFVFMMGNNGLPVFTEKNYKIMREKLN